MSRGSLAETGIYRLEPGRWRVVFRGPDGRQREETVRGRLKDARRLRAQRQLDRHVVGPALTSSGRTFFAEAAKQYLDAQVGLRDRTVDKNESSLRRHILPAFGHLPLGAITRGTIQKWIKELDSQLAPETVRGHFALLSGILNWSIAEGLLRTSPAVRINLPKKPISTKRYLTAEQVEELTSGFQARYQPLVLAGAYLGLRWQEVAGLQVDALVRDSTGASRLRIARTIERVRGGEKLVELTKSDASRRELWLPEFLDELLVEHLERYSDGTFIFTSPRGGFVRYNNFRTRVWLPAVERTGLTPLTFHELRHTAAALMALVGAGPLELKNSLGHKNISVTLNDYGHLYDEQRHALASRLAELRRAAIQKGRPTGQDNEK